MRGDVVVSAVIAWEDPPPVKRHKLDSQFDGPSVAAALRERPMVWALVAVDPLNAGLASFINSGRWRWCRPSGSFQSAHRTDDLGRRLVYARFIGASS